MIGKQKKGRGFRGLLDYLESSPGSRLIGGNMSGRNALELAREFKLSRQLNPEVERAVYHVSLSAAKSDRLDDDQWCEIANKYMEQMGFDSNQFATYRHNNTDDDHIHIVASRIRFDTSLVVNDSWDYVRSEKVLRELEKEYGLTQVQGSREKLARTTSTGQIRRMRREQQEYENGKRATPPELPIKEKLQELIDHATTDHPTMPQLIERLQLLGVEVRHGFTRNGKSKGISYLMDGQAFSGSQLGSAYTFPGLQKHKAVDYKFERDDLKIQQQLLNPVKPIQINQHPLKDDQPDTALATAFRETAFRKDDNEKIQFERTQIVAPIIAGILEATGTTRFEGEKHTVYWELDQLVLVRNSDRAQLIRARYKESHWEQTERSQLTDSVVQHFQQLIPKIESARSKQLEKEKSSENRHQGLSR
ncbi:hypothetical protein SD81_032295 [Tolypothrix campylonemoides VB511288]|nr:hypothetical protein SD81_032295 [Tolypothrix campylonemoides VB511288]